MPLVEAANSDGNEKQSPEILEVQSIHYLSKYNAQEKGSHQVRLHGLPRADPDSALNCNGQAFLLR